MILYLLLVFPSELRFITQIYRGKLYRRVIYWNNRGKLLLFYSQQVDIL